MPEPRELAERAPIFPDRQCWSASPQCAVIFSPSDGEPCDQRLCADDMSSKRRSAVCSLLAESAGELIAQRPILNAQPGELVARIVKALSQ